MIELGVAHSDGITAYFSPSPNKVFGIFATEADDDCDSPQEIDEKFSGCLLRHETRLLLVVVEGGLDFLLRYREHVMTAQAMVFCAPEVVLRQLGVTVVDRGWTPGTPTANLDDWLFPEQGPRHHWATAVAAAARVLSSPRPDRQEPTFIRQDDSTGATIARLDADGVLYDGDLNNERLGQVDQHGRVFSESDRLTPVGSVDSSGRVVTTAAPDVQLGLVDNEGKVFRGNGGGTPLQFWIGGPKPRAAGACLLLLLLDNR